MSQVHVPLHDGPCQGQIVYVERQGTSLPKDIWVHTPITSDDSPWPVRYWLYTKTGPEDYSYARYSTTSIEETTE